jgi:hypothetical protein
MRNALIRALVLVLFSYKGLAGTHVGQNAAFAFERTLVLKDGANKEKNDFGLRSVSIEGRLIPINGGPFIDLVLLVEK